MNRRLGFTLVEMLVTIAIMGVLIALLVPAVARCREAARSLQCSQQLGRVMLAAQQYESSQLYFPAAVWNESSPIIHAPEGKHHGWLLALLPHFDRPDVYRRFDFEASVYNPKNAEVRAIEIRLLRCPSDASLENSPFAASSYAGCYHPAETPIAEDARGALVLNRPLRADDYRDGLAQQLFAGEKQSDGTDLGWTSGSRSTLRNAGRWSAAEIEPSAPQRIDPDYVGGFGSPHTYGGWFVLADGHVRWISREIGPQVLRQLADRTDGALVSDADY
jgi:prepilin-type N-terminal cleavage/methylation domain-containing protein